MSSFQASDIDKATKEERRFFQRPSHDFISGKATALKQSGEHDTVSASAEDPGSVVRSGSGILVSASDHHSEYPH